MIKIEIRPRVSMTWSSFCETVPPKSIALDGFVTDGPQWDEKSLKANFDHHSGVVREATMSTAMQVMFAIKGGLMSRLGGQATVWVNDPDQDTCLATWLLVHHAQFDGVQSHPIINRLLALTDRLDITGGAYPMRLDDEVLSIHAWVFEPYQELRTSGALATADAAVMRNCMDAVHARLSATLMGQPGRRGIRRDCKILHDSPLFKIIDETGGNEARYALFSQGMNAFVSLVATRPDGRFVYSIGRRSRYIDFPLQHFYELLDAAEVVGLADDTWGGSDIIGGSSRKYGSELRWEEIRDILEGYFAQR